MLVLARCEKGREFLYRASSVHAVSKASANVIMEVLNKYKYQLGKGETWYKLEIDEYSLAYDIAQTQKFTIRKGLVKDHYNY